MRNSRIQLFGAVVSVLGALGSAGCGDDDCRRTLTCVNDGRGGTGGSASNGTGQGGSESTGGASGAVGGGGVGGDDSPPGSVVAVGFNHSCAAREGRLFCWGTNAAGQVGTGDKLPNLTAARVADEIEVVDVTCGRHHTCAVDGEGEVYCWGSNSAGQLGIALQITESLKPVLVPGLQSIVSVSAGNDHTCALDEFGLVWCWGKNDFGQLGKGNATPSALPRTTSLQGVRTISLAENRSCASDLNGDVLCWGSACSGAMCAPSEADARTPTSVGLTTIEAVATGYDHTCAISVGGTRCWGNNNSGQLGTGDFSSRATPTPAGSGTIPGLPKSIAAGDAFTCIVTGDSEVRCWGLGDAGELGDGGTDELPDPVSPVGLPDMHAVAAGADSTCGLASNDDVYCWGINPGDGTGSSLVPVLVQGIQ